MSADKWVRSISSSKGYSAAVGRDRSLAYRELPFTVLWTSCLLLWGLLQSKGIIHWSGKCNHLELGEVANADVNGLNVSNAHSWTCMDLYIFATPYRVTWDYYFLSREHTLEIKKWKSEAELEYVKNRGISIFLLQAGMLGTLSALWDVLPLFINNGWGEKSNIGFLEKHMGASFKNAHSRG
ncbi:hypothetical protein HAX54_051705 [Datura stramonium]|uniref:Uncharacterized protein n=1 Tax=Datura stramonium TaxID=4076 RepID=A0ABS8SY00_DATST|nr:hypothetical protein [Datura stramonium]